MKNRETCYHQQHACFLSKLVLIEGKGNNAMNDIYVNAAADLKVRPNSQLVEHLQLLATSGEPWRHVDVSRNHFGIGNGFNAFLVVLASQRGQLETLNLSYTELDTEHVMRLCDVLCDARRLHSIIMRNCGLYIASAQALLTLLRRNSSIVVLDVGSDENLPTPNTFPRAWTSRLEQQLERNTMQGEEGCA